MMSLRAVVSFSLAAFLTAAPVFAAKSHHSTAATHKSSSHTKGKAPKSHKMHGQQAIDPERVTQIQEALIREHYLTGNANGQWDSTTQAAMQKYQSTQGWQTKLMPDSRALVKLGLGPDYSSAINAKDMASAPPPPPAGSISTPQAAGFAAAAGVNR
jgi:peptidoglycan hydrolase-like protein with peptidoglycan-binding domain